MHIIFLGSAVSKRQINQGIRQSLSAAGSQFQLHMLKELNRCEGVELEVLSIVAMPPFPRHKALWAREHREALGDGLAVVQVPFFNVPLLKQLTQSYALFRYAKKRIRKDSVVFSYNLYFQAGCALVKLHNRYGVKAAALLADLPIDDDYRRRGLARRLRQLYNQVAERNIRKCPNLVVLNEEAVRLYAAPGARYLVMEGGVSPQEYFGDLPSGVRSSPDGRRHICYAGTLNEYGGVWAAVSAMELVTDQDIVLDIYGTGALREKIMRYVEEHSNVFFHGTLAQEEVIALEKRAWLLLNPRPVEDPIARVTFPSKIFEYMASGTPVLTTRLNGFTPEYSDKMFFASGSEPKILAAWINRIARLPERDLRRMGERAREFVLREKSWTVQVRKIHEFLLDGGEDGNLWKTIKQNIR
ncbi:MAG: glycosyltransferase [Clostridium sp.]|jgi:glycosyltransferase involved in cell wall biosynthesis|nr:glycosyltransferase [Clostridium sp.]